MKKLIIIDDEPLARSLVKEYLQDFPDLEVAAECENGFEGIKAIAQHQPDLLILDIQMPKITGFEMLELIEAPPAVIFTTAYDQYAIKAFESNAIDYLLKPFSRERFGAAIAKWRGHNGHDAGKLERLLDSPERMQEEQQRIVVRNGREIAIVPAHDIVYIEAFDDYVKIFTRDSYFLKKKTMNYYEASLGEGFFRTHRSFLINVSQLTRIEPLEKNTYVAVLKNGKKVPLSRSSYLRLKERLGI
jgi:two-component system, LytTR family, response regulator